MTFVLSSVTRWLRPVLGALLVVFFATSATVNTMDHLQHVGGQDHSEHSFLSLTDGDEHQAGPSNEETPEGDANHAHPCQCGPVLFYLKAMTPEYLVAEAGQPRARNRDDKLPNHLSLMLERPPKPSSRTT
jgi:hypothetical protein